MEEERFRAVFRRAHAGHAACADDEWLTEPCRNASGEPAARPLVWSRRNGPWRRVPVLWVGAAPGNAGGRGAGDLGAHGTRIPFGGDVAGTNLEALLGAIGLDRNHTFITAALNQLPVRGGGEPTPTELREIVGDYPSSLHLLRDTILAAGPSMVVALGNVAVRATFGAAALATLGSRLPTIERLRAAGLARGNALPWGDVMNPDDAFARLWRAAWADAPVPVVLWLTHPSAQNMSPFAGRDTRFHERMLEARDALRRATREQLGWSPPPVRPALPSEGIYALPEWTERIAPRLARMDALWRRHGV